MRLDGDGTFLEVHAPKEDDLAMPATIIIGKNVRDLMAPELVEQHMRASAYVLETGKVYEYEYTLEVLSGVQHFDARLVKSGPNEITSIVRNITEKHRLQEQSEARQVALMLERERRIILERFVQDASHDLRTPLTALMTSGYLLDRYIGLVKTQLPELIDAFQNGRDTQPFIDTINDAIRRLEDRYKMMNASTERLRALVDAMFEMIWLDSEDSLLLQPGHLEGLAESAVYAFQAAAEAHGVQLTLEKTETPVVMLHGEMMQRAIYQLVQNALNVTPAGGHITLRMAVTAQDVVLAVTDTGIGIAEENLTNIFQRFYRVDEARTANNGGSGLGLAIAQRIVALHGGRIEVESEIGRGSTFRIVLPRA